MVLSRNVIIFLLTLIISTKISYESYANMESQVCDKMEESTSHSNDNGEDLDDTQIVDFSCIDCHLTQKTSTFYKKTWTESDHTTLLALVIPTPPPIV